jgi:hypothetical protein
MIGKAPEEGFLGGFGLKIGFYFGKEATPGAVGPSRWLGIQVNLDLVPTDG